MLNLLKPTEGIVSVPIDEYMEYSPDTIATVADILAYILTEPGGSRRKIREEIIEELQPWSPVTSEGKMGKRIASYMYKTHSVSLTEEVKSGLANYLGSDTPATGFAYDITSEFDWRAGQFGDSNSCFLGSHRSSLTRLSEAEGTALRLYNTNGEGIARSLVCPSPYEGVAMVFNAYGNSLQQFASRIKTICKGEADVRIVEAGANITVNLGYALLVAESGKAPDRVTLPVRVTLQRDPNRKEKCSHCGLMVPHAQLRRVIVDKRGLMVCNGCLENHFFEDQAYGGFYHVGEMESVTAIEEGLEGSKIFMRYKVAKHNVDAFVECAECENKLRRGNGYFVMGEDGRERVVCKWCVVEHDYTLECWSCGRWRKNATKCACMKG